jgi:uncharacterized protein
MVIRKYWLSQIENAWRRRSIIWLTGVRRVGKTTLCQALPNTEYLDCELPSVRRRLEDPEAFLDAFSGKRIIMDEIHRLGNPAEILKIAADHYPQIKIIATGSSTLGASAKFKDTLAGRKVELWLTPMVSHDLVEFQNTDLRHRFLRGGLPPFFLAPELPGKDFQEWLDAYWAKDIQELFRLERKYSFQRFVELLLSQSGSIFEATRFTAPCEVSRSTIHNYLSVLEATFVMHIVRPFSHHRSTEIVAAPKVYGFDTGFICTFKGWESLRTDDLGLLWEHFVLNEMHGRLQSREINYWRDKRGHEMDFILRQRNSEVTAIECKWSADHFEPANLISFRKQYPKGENLVASSDVKQKYARKYQGEKVVFVGLDDLIRIIS